MRQETPGGLAVLRETRQALCEGNPGVGLFRPLASEKVNRTRGRPAKSGLSQRELQPWRGKDPGELRARLQSKPLSRVTDSRVEQNPVGGQQCQRHEGNGAGNGVRLRGRKKALEGGPKSGSGMKQGR